MNIPTREECYSLFRQYGLPNSIQKHCGQVERIASFLAKKLKEKGEPINTELVMAGTLLHDICRHVAFKDYADFEGITLENIAFQKKLQTKYPHCTHAEAAYHELKKIYPEVALIAKKHFLDNLLQVSPDIRPTTWEEKLVFYADHRVKHTEIATLRERLDDLYIRHKDHFEKYDLSELDRRIFALEEEIFNKLGTNPDKLGEYIE